MNINMFGRQLMLCRFQYSAPLCSPARITHSLVMGLRLIFSTAEVEVLKGEERRRFSATWVAENTEEHCPQRRVPKKIKVSSSQETCIPHGCLPPPSLLSLGFPLVFHTHLPEKMKEEHLVTCLRAGAQKTSRDRSIWWIWQGLLGGQ